MLSMMCCFVAVSDSARACDWTGKEHCAIGGLLASGPRPVPREGGFKVEGGLHHDRMDYTVPDSKDSGVAVQFALPEEVPGTLCMCAQCLGPCSWYGVG